MHNILYTEWEQRVQDWIYAYESHGKKHTKRLTFWVWELWLALSFLLLFLYVYIILKALPWDSDGEDSACSAGDPGPISRKILWRGKMKTSEAKNMKFPEMIFTNHFQRRFSVIHRLGHWGKVNWAEAAFFRNLMGIRKVALIRSWVLVFLHRGL